MRTHSRVALAALMTMLACSKGGAERRPESMGDRGQSVPEGGGPLDLGNGKPDVHVDVGASPSDGANEVASPNRDAAPEAPSVDAGPERHYLGQIRWSVSEIGLGPNSNASQLVSATFALGEKADSEFMPEAASRCQGKQKIGNCCVGARTVTETSTRPTDGGALPPPPPPPPSNDPCGSKYMPLDAGILNFLTNGSQIGRGVFDAMAGRYRFQPLAVLADKPLWKDGDQLTVQVPGSACVPKLEGSVKAATSLVTQLPAEIRLSEGATVSWTPDPSPGHIDVILIGELKGDAGRMAIDCEAPDSAGKVFADPSLLQPFGPGDITVSIQRFSHGRTTVPGITLLSHVSKMTWIPAR